MTPEEAIQAAARLIVRAALDVIQADPHGWSERPCQTCRIVVDLTGLKFGCTVYREQMAERRKA